MIDLNDLDHGAGGDMWDAGACMGGFGMMSLALVAGVSGPVGWISFGFTAYGTFVSCYTR